MSRATAREWKPGDVVFGKVNLWSGRLFRTPRGWVDQDGDHWADSAAELHELRPLTVVDPEDRAQVERLEDLYLLDVHDDHRNTTDCMAVALRELANPKLEEPTGLGAVVVDVEDQRYVRGLPLANSQQPWWVVAPHGDRAARWLSWDEFTAVTVIAPGVPA